MQSRPNLSPAQFSVTGIFAGNFRSIKRRSRKSHEAFPSEMRRAGVSNSGIAVFGTGNLSPRIREIFALHQGSNHSTVRYVLLPDKYAY